MSRKSLKEIQFEGTPEKQKENKLITLIKEDEKLKKDREHRMEFISMGEFFLEDFKNNLYKTSIEMNEDFPQNTIDEWKEFLNYPVVRKYIKEFQDEKLNSVADQGLSSGDKSAIGIKKAAQDYTGSSNNANIILIRVPEKKNWEEEA